MKCIVGLGNPGIRYRNTRHNAGFLALEYMSERFDAEHHESTEEYECYRTLFCDAPLLLMAPKTYMNNSGLAVRTIMQKNDLSPDDILIVYDDFQIPFGTLRLRPSGSDGGHNGIASVITHLESEEIARIRIGVGGTTMPKQHLHDTMAAYVLSPFTDEEMELLPALNSHLTDACAAWMLMGLQSAMSRYNKDFFSPAGAG